MSSVFQSHVCETRSFSVGRGGILRDSFHSSGTNFLLEFISHTGIVCMFTLFSKSIHALHGITIASMPTGSDLIVHDMERIKVPQSLC